MDFIIATRHLSPASFSAASGLFVLSRKFNPAAAAAHFAQFWRLAGVKIEIL